MTTQNEKSPAPEQASEAADQRPRTEENPAAEGILDASAVGGNGTSSKVSHADALTPEKIRELKNLSSDPRLHESERAAIRAILAARLVEQHEAAPADERTAFPRYTEWMHLRSHGAWSDGVPDWARDHTGRMNDFTAASAVIEELAARAAPSQPAAEQEATAAGLFVKRSKFGPWIEVDKPEPEAVRLYTAPPAQVATRQRLTLRVAQHEDGQIEQAKEIVADWVRNRGTYIDGEAYGAAVDLVAFAISRTVAAHQSEPRAEAKATVAVALYDKAREFLYGNLDTLRWAIELADATGNCSQARGLEAVEYQIRRLFSTARAGESQ
ncbi:hypothetical protein SAMN03159335_05443 [Burkholderia cepacia]|uniref:hypothetical protein n=1 Tax=Burkholderia cepacia TaxID=292 RepID=UPI0008D71623|nr:hypothetical protein [Burkholderia cepacia]SEU36405.1 hypothetical protein SAMN03159335_05443 [Burkholderia cepacia]